MNKDTFEGAARSTVGQGERILGQTLGDKGTAAQGLMNEAAGKAHSALGSAKDAVSSGVDAVSTMDMSALRDQINELTQKVSELAQQQFSAGRNQVAGAVGTAAETLSQTAASAQDRLAVVESDVESRIKKNPWGAVAVAGLIGLLIGKMT